MECEELAAGLVVLGILMTQFVLFFMLLVLKLAELGSVATWSWAWVFSPLWLPASLWLATVVFCSLLQVH